MGDRRTGVRLSPGKEQRGGKIMGFLKPPKVWTNVDLGLLKWCCIFFGMIIGAYLSDVVKDYLWVFIIVTVALAVKPTIYYWKRSK